MTKKQKSWQEVSEANRRFYDNVAQIYNDIDSRRRSLKHQWLNTILAKLKDEVLPKFPNEKLVFLDAGCGLGFLSSRAGSYFDNIIMVDISKEMLDRASVPNCQKIVADCCQIPLESNVAHIVGAFAMLHHLQDPGLFFKEAYRLLKPGGILFCDHDIESRFIKNFLYPLKIYRFFFDHGKKFIRACPSANLEDYALSEYHGDGGLDGANIFALLKGIGFRQIDISYHWQGMFPLIDLLPTKHLNFLKNKKGTAPVCRIIAKKLDRVL